MNDRMLLIFMKRVYCSLIIIFLVLFLKPFSYAQTQQEAYENDTLYSQEYFDYLIECASYEQQKEKDNQKEKDEITLSDSSISQGQDLGEDFIFDNYEPFKLKIENYDVGKYSQSYIRENSKTLIPVGSRFSFMQDTLQFRNKYNSNDYRILAGAEYKINNFLNLTGGLETNYRGYDQNPNSRKLYFTPVLTFKDIVSVSFHNKFDTSNHSQDHDIGLSVSPLKSKAMDFGIYAGTTQQVGGAHSESINFSTNFYFF